MDIYSKNLEDIIQNYNNNIALKIEIELTNFSISVLLFKIKQCRNTHKITPSNY